MTIDPTSVIWITRTSRDPNGRVFQTDGRIYRAIHPHRVNFMRAWLESDTCRDLIRQGLLVGAEATDLALEGYGLVLEHPLVRHKCAPSEQTFAFVQDGARVLCRLNEALIPTDRCLVDSHMWNLIGGRRGRPLWLDFGSVAEWDAHYHLSAIRQFLDNYIAPLAILAADNRLSGIVRRSLDETGFTPGEATAILGDQLPPLYALAEGALSREGQLAFWEAARRWIDALSYSLSPTFWEGYYGEQNALFSFVPPRDGIPRSTGRIDLIASIVGSREWRSVADIGCNEGFFAAMAARCTSSVFAMDFDGSAIEDFYRRLDATDLACDFTLATYDFSKQQGFSARYPPRAELVLALALTHHLALAQKLSFEDIVERLAAYSEDVLLVEYMPNGLYPQDAKDVVLPSWYTLEAFTEALRSRFKSVDVLVPSDELRTLVRASAPYR